MNHKTFFGLAAATAICTVTAAGTAIFSDSPARVDLAQEQVFPDMASNPDAVAKIVIETGEDTFSLVRGEDGWTVPEKHNYRASAKEVRDLIVGLSDMRYAAARTAKPELYERLDLEDPAPEGASRLVRVEGTDGKVLAEAVIGKQRYRLTGDQKQGTYLRLPGDAQSWLVTGGVGVEAQLNRWLDRQIIELSADDIHRIEITPATGKPYAIERTDADSAFALQAVLDGDRVKEGETFSRLSSALASLRLDDVRPMQVSFVTGSTARFVTFDGVEITAQLLTDGDTHWASFDVAVDPPMAMPEAFGKLSDRLDGWQFALPTTAAERLITPLEDWLDTDESTS